MANKIFQTLSKIDVTKHVKSKNGATYLPWASCWAIVMKHYPQSYYTIHKQKIYVVDGDRTYEVERPWFTDTTGWVEVEVHVVDGEEEVTHTETYPIMDYKNKSIEAADITTTDVNKSTKRALVKAVATCTGLGLHLFYGEDLPGELQDLANQQNAIHELAKKKIKLSDKAKEKVLALIKEAEMESNPERTEDLLTGKISDINEVEVLKRLEAKLLAVRK